MARSRLRISEIIKLSLLKSSIICVSCHFRYLLSRRCLVLLKQIKMLLFTAIFAAFGLVVNGQLIDISKCSEFSVKFEKCKTDHPVDSVAQLLFQEYILLYTISSDVLCSANFSDQLECVIDAYRGCGDANTTQLVAESAAYKKAAKALCDNKDDLGLNCITESYSTCSTAGLDTPTISSSSEDIKNFYCQAYDQSIECTDTDEKLVNCDKPKTKTILKEMMMDLKPQGCGATNIILATSILVLSLISSIFF